MWWWLRYKLYFSRRNYSRGVYELTRSMIGLGRVMSYHVVRVNDMPCSARLLSAHRK